MTTLQQLQSGHGVAAANGRTHLPATTRRALTQMQQSVVINTARVQAQAYVGREALFAVADLSELEGRLASLCPLATSRLEAIANISAMSIARTLSDFRG
jgi:hypothetical protein